MEMPKGISVCCLTGALHVRVVGRGTFQNGQPLRRYALEMIDKGATQCVVDLWVLRRDGQHVFGGAGRHRAAAQSTQRSRTDARRQMSAIGISNYSRRSGWTGSFTIAADGSVAAYIPPDAAAFQRRPTRTLPSSINRSIKMRPPT